MLVLTFQLLTIFPGIFESFIKTSLIGKAVERGLLEFTLRDIRAFASPPHFQVDDTPYGGGAGMVMKPEPLVAAIEAARAAKSSTRVIALSASGSLFTQRQAERLSTYQDITLVCGRYEGIDQRAIEIAVDEEISIGDYVLMGGEIAAMVIIEAVARLRPDIIGNEQSLSEESFCRQSSAALLLEAPHYTRPPEFRGKAVPEVLLSGNHREIAHWRSSAAQEKTKRVRPDLIARQPPPL